MESVSPDVYEPPLTRWGQVWRTAAMLVISLVVCLSPLPAAWRQAHWMAVVDLLLGATAFVLVFYRRRHPMAVATVITVFGIISCFEKLAVTNRVQIAIVVHDAGLV